jgi:hypothetical protein
MGEIADRATQAFRNYVTDGVPGSGANEPDKGDIRALFRTIDVAVYAAQAGTTTVADIAARDAFFANEANQGKLVYVNNNNGSADDPENGVYEYVGGAARLAQGFYNGVAAVVQPLVDEAATSASSAAASADFAAVVRTDYSHLESIGAADVDDRTGSVSVGTVTFGTAISRSGKGIRVTYFGKGTGTAYIQIASRSGTTTTIIDEVAIDVTPGLHTILLPNLEFAQGDHVGFRSTGGLIAQQAGAGVGFGGVWTTNSQISAGNTYTDATLSNVDYAIRFELLSEGVTAELVGDMNARLGSDDPPVTVVGLPDFAPLGSATAIGSATYVLDQAAPYDMKLTRIREEVRTAGPMALRRYTRSGSDFTRVGSDVNMVFGTTGSIDTTDVPDLIVKKGEYIGIKAVSPMQFDFVANGNYPTPYYSGNSAGTSFTAGAIVNVNQLNASLEFEPVSITDRVGALEESSGAAALSHPTDAVHIVWLLGESHVAGRATSFESNVPVGRGFRFRRADGSIAHLVDPTGNDASATSGSGNGSWGPSIGQAMLDASHGAVGALIVNSGEGGTQVFHWYSSGASWTQAKADWDAAIAAIKAAKIPVAGVTIAIGLGSNDAGDGTAKATFKAGMIDLAERARAYVQAGDHVPVAIVQTGPFADGSFASGVLDCQQAQAEIVREEPDIFMATSAPKFALEKGWFLDNVHFIQTGNDAIGPGVAAVALAHGAGLYPAGLE